MSALIEETTRVRLYGFTEECELPVRSMLFGELVKLALPVVEHYHSDLYHDALWIDRYVTGECSFWFVVRDHGTHIGTDDAALDAVFNAFSGDDSQRAYRVTLNRDRREWFAVIAPLPSPTT